ncbi:MAG: IS5 family transposase [Thermoplasmata archaeon]
MKNLPKSPNKYKYKVTNWKAYNNSLKKRGQVTIWLSAALLSVWKDLDVRKIAVGEQIYPDSIIEFCLLIKNVYHLPFRQTTGFIADLLALQGLAAYCVPDYSTLCRRAKHIRVSFSKTLKQPNNIHVLVDSTGLKVYGQGEWMVKKHGASKHRTWLKLHLSIDAATQEIVANLLTDNSIDDASAAKEMLTDAQNCLASLTGDGAYDKFFFREFLGNELLQKIPPPCNAVVKVATAKSPVPPYLSQRNQAVERIKEIGRKAWKKEIGYHRRSLAETTMFRYKVIFGDKASSRVEENQRTEVNIKCKILNKFTSIGMPKSVKIFEN